MESSERWLFTGVILTKNIKIKYFLEIRNFFRILIYFPFLELALREGLTFMFGLLLLNPRDFLAAEVRPLPALFLFLSFIIHE